MSILPVSSPPVPASCPDVDNFRHADRLADRLARLDDSPDNALGDHPGPSWDADRYEPAYEDEVQECGWQAGYRLDWTAQPPAHLDHLHQLLWLVGKVQGARARHEDDAADAAFRREMAEWAARREGVAADRHPEEVVRAVGCLAARAEGGVR